MSSRTRARRQWAARSNTGEVTCDSIETGRHNHGNLDDGRCEAQAGR
jgi:hypothetical protein